MSHEFKLKVYYQDTDAGGIVYHPNYLNFAERARTEMIHDLGLSNTQLKEQENLIIVVRHIEVDYSASARLEDKLTVQTSVVHIGHTSFHLKQVVMRDGLACATMIVKLVCIDVDSGRPVRIPDILKEKIE
jgi:acyl-CoA thioester hydrolase